MFTESIGNLKIARNKALEIPATRYVFYLDVTILANIGAAGG